jgi:hypothetical protein
MQMILAFLSRVAPKPPRHDDTLRANQFQEQGHVFSPWRIMIH